MQVAITSRHGTLSPSANDYISGKAEKILTFHDRVTAIGITVDFANGKSKVELLVDAEHKHNFVASETADDAIAAFDLALHKMEQQIRKYKERIQDHKHTPSVGEITREPNT